MEISIRVMTTKSSCYVHRIIRINKIAIESLPGISADAELPSKHREISTERQAFPAMKATIYSE
jgi:hypothetical protein